MSAATSPGSAMGSGRLSEWVTAPFVCQAAVSPAPVSAAAAAAVAAEAVVAPAGKLRSVAQRRLLLWLLRCVEMPLMLLYLNLNP